MIKGGIPVPVYIRGKEYQTYDLQHSLWMHKKHPHLYRIMYFKNFVIEATGEPAIVYMKEDGNPPTKWIRPWDEFFDGRFKRILNGEESNETKMFWNMD